MGGTVDLRQLVIACASVQKTRLLFKSLNGLIATAAGTSYAFPSTMALSPGDGMGMMCSMVVTEGHLKKSAVFTGQHKSEWYTYQQFILTTFFFFDHTWSRDRGDKEPDRDQTVMFHLGKDKYIWYVYHQHICGK